MAGCVEPNRVVVPSVVYCTASHGSVEPRQNLEKVGDGACSAMANYHYDEAGNMAAFFLISVLAIVLIPLTLASVARTSTSKSLLRSPQRGPDYSTEHTGESLHGCQCTHCLARRKQVLAADRPSICNPKLTKRSVIRMFSPDTAHVAAPERWSSSSVGRSWLSWSTECATPSQTTRCTTRMKYWAFPPYVLMTARDPHSSVLAGYHGKGNQIIVQEALQGLVRIPQRLYARHVLTTCQATQTRSRRRSTRPSTKSPIVS